MTIAPSGTQTISGPTLISASPPELASGVVWSLAGPGSLSGTSGAQVTYRPATPGSPPATVTATASAQTASVTFTIATPQLQKVVIPGLSADASVTYDQFDIPHIFCAVPADCFGVQGYIQAQDRLFQMDLFRRTAEGRLAELVGAVEAPQDQLFLALFTTRDLRRIEDKLVDALSPDVAAGVNAYTAGVNAYLAFLAAHPTLMPQEYAQVPGVVTPGDIPPWFPKDTLAIGRLQQFQLSESIEEETGYGLLALTFGPGGRFDNPARFSAYVLPVQPINGFTLSPADTTTPSTGLRSNLPPASTASFPGAPSGLGKVNAEMRELNGVFGSIREGSGSNNWVVDGAHSATGFAMVANDPHLPLQYPPLFHLIAMTSADGKLNMAGGSFPGIPGAQVGRGAHVGWGVTVVGYDVTDLYQEQLVGCTGTLASCTAVQFGTINVPLGVKTYPFNVKGAQPTTFDVVVVPHHGPILPVSFDPVHNTALSVRWTGHEVTPDLEAFLGLIEATAVGKDDPAETTTAFAALRKFDVGAQNFVLADDAGHIGYDPHALVPIRNWAFTPPTAGTAGHVPWFPLRSDGSAEWGVAAGNCAAAPAIPGPCWVPDNQLPRGIDPVTKGYFATANSDPAGYTGHPAGPLPAPSPFFSSINPALYPYLSFDWSDPSDIRYSRIAEVLATGTSNGGKISLANMQALQADHQSLLAKVFEDRKFYPASTDATYGKARTLLQSWANNAATPYDCPTGLTSPDPKSAPVADQATLTNSAACFLFHAFLNTLLHNVFDDDFAVVSATTGQSFGGDTGAEIRALAVALLPNPDATGTFCDDVSPTFTVTASKTCGTQVINALVTAYTALSTANGTDTTKWLWGRAHTLQTVSPASPLISNGFTTGPFARPGGALTVDVGNPSGSQSSQLSFAYGSGSNVRHISVMDPDAASAQVKMQLPGPERDAQFGVFPSSSALLNQYVQNQYFDFLLGHQIDNKGVSAQGFSKQ